MRLLKLFIMIFSMLSLAACASGTQYKHMAASMPKLKADEGRIYFYRTASLVGFAVQPPIMLDGAKVGSSKPGGFFYVDATSGLHEISAASDPDRKLAMTLEKGEIKYVKISPAFGDTTGEIKFDVVSEVDAMKVLPDLAFSGETD